MTKEVSPLKVKIDEAIKLVASSEKVTKKALSELSRDLLEYVPVSNDIATVNRLLNVLTPMNRETALKFFDYFLPWDLPTKEEVEGDKIKSIKFGKKTKGDRAINRIASRRATFLEDKNNTIWTWSNKHLEVSDRKPTDWRMKLTNDIKKALDPEKGGLTQAQVIASVLDGGVSLDTFMKMASTIKEKMDSDDETMEPMDQPTKVENKEPMAQAA